MVRKKTALAFAQWIADEANVALVLRRLMEGRRLSNLCKELGQPYTLLYPFFHSTPELAKRYDAALAGRAEDLMQETVEIADSVRGAEEGSVVSAAKLAVEARQQLAKSWNRDRYGERVHIEKTVSVSADAGLIGTIKDLLALKPAVPALPERLVGEGSAVPAEKS